VLSMQAMKIYLDVGDDGMVSLPALHQFRGKKIEVVIIETDESNDSLLMASESSLEFWDNPVDDAVWNNV